MHQKWLITHVLEGLRKIPEEPQRGEGAYLSMDEATTIVAETIDYVGQQGDDVEYTYLVGHRKRLAHSLTLIPFAESDEASCLDVGCWGYMAMWVWKYLGYRHVEGIEWRPDVKTDVINRTIRLNEDVLELQSYNFDLSRDCWPLENKYDTVLLLEVLEHINSDPMAVMVNISRRMDKGSMLVMSVPNAVSYKTLKEFLTGMPPWNYWFYHPNLAHEPRPRHCFEYTPIVFKSLLLAAGFEEKVFRTIFAFSDPEGEMDITQIGEALSLSRDLFGDTMIAQAKKFTDETPVRYPDVLYSSDGYYQTAYPVLEPFLKSATKNFREKHGAENEGLRAENENLQAKVDELLFVCDCYLQNELTLRQAVRVAEAKCSEVSGKLAERTSELVSVQRQFQEISSELVSVQHQLQQIYASTSWRITAPLRKLMLIFRRTMYLTGRLLTWVWWTVTLRLPEKLRERRRVRAMRSN